jgi:hypothetical protein
MRTALADCSGMTDVALTALQVLLGELGIAYINCRPYHPQTCGNWLFADELRSDLCVLIPKLILTVRPS